MPKMNFDEDKNSLFDPIEFTIDGKDYSITKVKKAMLKGFDNTEGDFGVFSFPEKLAQLTGVNPEVFEDSDLVKLKNALEFVMTAITEAMKIQTADTTNLPEKEKKEKNE